MSNKKKWKIAGLVFALFALAAIHNQQLAVTDPENTYINKISREFRLLLNPPENELQHHIIGKDISCEKGEELYKKVASATVIVYADKALGAGVFIEPQLIVTANHVVHGKRIVLILPNVKNDGLTQPGLAFPVDSVHRIHERDLAFIKTKKPYPYWLPLHEEQKSDQDLIVVGHPNRKFYSVQKAHAKQRAQFESSDYIFFRDNEVFFGNSGG
ncbi:MAG: hypothetical protein GWM98_13645, partial [Nitrospinaceae bacterium]|nr:trypsin-like peptidase domain-containing protein [Nitrospinaceae bacterium]NIR55322.1 trypsin-like peptidase domain-containing protein [Nitrospinaceae bacterium]NIS85761.1 trypsin-like peptidase domain-containing protein [Nitrospinaceae bacterium]NIT82611.1 trypsin-like peptidase domain-containing protein [Nitrospinaceae bacterium]NIU44816.1 trypsin-like peptidase domain-containing protein [Nitrospinaceae bacterium]